MTNTLTLTKEQIEAAIQILSRAQQEILEGDIEEATAYRADFNRKFGVQQLHALCDLALQALDMRGRAIENLPASTFSKLFDTELVLSYRERFHDWTASFNGCDVWNGTSLVSEYGYGPTQYDAVISYQRAIDGKTLVFEVHKASRREIVFNLSSLPTGGE